MCVNNANSRGSRDGVVVRALASHQCGPGSIPGLGVICGLSLLLVLVLASRGFSPGTPVFPSPQKPTFPNSNSIWTQWKKSHLVDPLLIPIYFIFILFIYLKLNKARDFVIQRIRNKYVWMCHRKFSYLRNVCTAIYTKCARIFSY